MGDKLVILDGNCFLHAGKAPFSDKFNNLGFPTGGIYMLMNKIAELNSADIEFCVVFDSPSFRKNVNTEYKESRKVDYKVLAQSNALIPCLKRAGINVLQVPEFEGDDLIANVVQANQNKRIFIYTCDYDIALNVSRTVSITGVHKNFPAIMSTNFSSVMESAKTINRYLPYNTLGMYKVIFGDSSDNISSIGEEAEGVWGIFMKLYDRDYTSKGQSYIVNKKFCQWFISVLQNTVSKETFRKFNENIELVFPRMLTEKEIADNNISLTEFNNINGDNFLDIYVLFGLKKGFRTLTGNTMEFPELTDKQRDWLLRKAKEYKLRKDAVDAEIDMFSKAENMLKDIGVEDTLMEQTDFNSALNGMNVGGF